MNWFKRFDLWYHSPKLADFYFMFTQMYLLLNSGSPMQDALKSIADVIPNENLQLALKRIVKRLNSGMSASAAFGAEKVFPRVVPPTVEAGDKSGQLSTTFNRLSELMWLQHNLYTKVNNALFVPKLAGGMIVVLIVGFVKFAIPKYVEMFNENGMKVPDIVTGVSGLVNTLSDYWYLTFLAIYLIFKGIKTFCIKHKVFIDGLRLKIPVYRPLHFMFLQHQFVSTLELMLSSGLNMLSALNQAISVCDNALMAEALKKVRVDMQKGNSIAYSIRKNNKQKVFDDVLILVLDSGERTSRMTEVLVSAKYYYERILNNSVDPIATKITFLVMIPMGLIIVGIYAFTMVPMLSYMSNVAG